MVACFRIMETASFQSKFSRFVKKNVVMIVMLPIIGGIHWGWIRIQEVEKFVPKTEKRELPILEVIQQFLHLSEPGSNSSVLQFYRVPEMSRIKLFR